MTKFVASLRMHPAHSPSPLAAPLLGENFFNEFLLRCNCSFKALPIFSPFIPLSLSKIRNFSSIYPAPPLPPSTHFCQPNPDCGYAPHKT